MRIYRFRWFFFFFIASFVVIPAYISMLKVLLGYTGNRETWQIVAAIVGFTGLALLFLIFVYVFGKFSSKSIKKNGYLMTAVIKVKDPSKIELVKTELKKLQAKTLTEAGCDFFSIQQDTKERAQFIIWERFDNKEAFKKHFKYPHTKKYVKMDLTGIVQYFQTDILGWE